MAKLEFQRKEAFKVIAHPSPQPLKSHSDDSNKEFSFILVVVFDQRIFRKLRVYPVGNLNNALSMFDPQSLVRV